METSENSSASVELTSTQGSVLTTDRNDATQNLVGDSVPSSSSDANLRGSFMKTIQDDPISSTSDSVSVFNFTDEKGVPKDLVSDTDFFSSELNIESITTEKISEDVEDIANDLENLLGETNNDFIIPISVAKEGNASRRNQFNESESKEIFDINIPILDNSKNDSDITTNVNITEKVDSTESGIKETRPLECSVEIAETSLQGNQVDTEVINHTDSDKLQLVDVNNEKIETEFNIQNTENSISQTNITISAEVNSTEDSVPLSESLETEKANDESAKESCDNKEMINAQKSDQVSENTDICTITKSLTDELKADKKTADTANDIHREDLLLTTSISTEKQAVEEENNLSHNLIISEQSYYHNTETDVEQNKIEIKEDNQENDNKPSGNLQDTVDEHSKEVIFDDTSQLSITHKSPEATDNLDGADGEKINITESSAIEERQEEAQAVTGSIVIDEKLIDKETTLPFEKQEHIEINKTVVDVEQQSSDNDRVDFVDKVIDDSKIANKSETEYSSNDAVKNSENNGVPATGAQEIILTKEDITPSSAVIVETKVDEIEQTTGCNDCTTSDSQEAIGINKNQDKSESEASEVTASLLFEEPSTYQEQMELVKLEGNEVSSTILVDNTVEDQPKNTTHTADVVIESLPNIKEDVKNEEEEVTLNEVVTSVLSVSKHSVSIGQEVEKIEPNESITSDSLEVLTVIVEEPKHQTIKDEECDIAPVVMLEPMLSDQNLNEEVTQPLEIPQENVERIGASSSVDISVDVGTTEVVHEVTNEDTNVLVEEKITNKIEMTISSIIEEAIQDEHESSNSGVISKILQETSGDSTDFSEVVEVRNEDVEDKAVHCDQIEEGISQRKSALDVPPDSNVIESVVSTSSSEITAVLDLEGQQESDISNEKLATESNEQLFAEIQEGRDNLSAEMTSKIENENCEVVQSKENLTKSEELLEEIANQDDKSAHKSDEVSQDAFTKLFENVCQKSPEVFNESLEFENGEMCENILSETKTTSPIPETLTVIPDSLDEGNIAALAITDPSCTEYYHIEDDVAPQAVDDKTISEKQEETAASNETIVQEPDSLLSFQTESKPTELIKVADQEVQSVPPEEVLPALNELITPIESTASCNQQLSCKVHIGDASDQSLNETKSLLSRDEQNISLTEVNPMKTLLKPQKLICTKDTSKMRSKQMEAVESRSSIVAEGNVIETRAFKEKLEILRKSSVSVEKSKQLSKDKTKPESASLNSESCKKVFKDRASVEVDGNRVAVQSMQQTSSQIQPLIIDVDNPIEIIDDSEVLTPQYSSKMSTKELLKMTITKHKTDSPKEEDSILKIYDPKEDKKNQKVKESIPKLIIKPVVRSQSPPSEEPEQAIPKLLIRNMSPNRPCSPKVSKAQKSENSSSLKVTIKPVVKPDENQKSSPKLSIKSIVKADEDTFTPKITIKPIVKPEEEILHNPKITIKPIVKPEEETTSSPRITIKPIIKPEEIAVESPSPRITIKPLVRPDEDILREEERSHSPRVTIKPLKGDESKISGEEMVHSPRITIKPIKPPDEEEPSPKITIKPLIKPLEEDRHEKKEGSPKIKIKPIVKPPEEQPELIDFEEQIKQERIVLKINTKESRKREATEEIEKLAKIKLKFSKEGGRAHIVSDQKLKRALEESRESESKRQKIETVDITSSPESKDIIEIKDDSNPPYDDPIESIPTFQINVQTVAVQNNPAPVAVTPAPRKRGRPRKIPLVVREEFKDPKEEEPEPVPVVEETGRPKRSCRGPSVCTTLGIKPRKPRGGGAATTRGRGRGRGSRGGSRGSNRQQRVTTRQRLLEEEVAAVTSRKLVADEIIEIPDDDPKEEERPPQPLPQTQPEIIEVRASTPPSVVVEAIVAESATESVAEKVPSEVGSDVVLIEEETRMSADIHSSRAQTPAKQVLAVADVEDTQSSVQSTATTESVKVVRKGSRLEVHQEPECDIISPEQLAEYYWGGSGPYMLQEQVAQFLGIKSFKRKYPGIQRRPVDMQERDFIRESSLASEAMCDMGLTAVASADILDIMYSDFQHKYEEYCKHQRDRHTKDIINKQKALNLAASQEKSKHDLTQQAVQSAAAWNITLNKSRREERRACMDLQTFTVNYPRGKFKNPEKAKVGNYPIALVPGQYTDNYKDYTPNELYNLPLNTMMNQTLSIVRDDDSQSDGSGSDSDTTTSDSDSTSSDSSDEDCNVCTLNSRKIAAN